MKIAILLDSQGFTKHIIVADRPNPVMDIPIETSIAAHHLEALGHEASTFKIRRFILEGKIGDNFMYVERV